MLYTFPMHVSMCNLACLFEVVPMYYLGMCVAKDHAREGVSMIYYEILALDSNIRTLIYYNRIRVCLHYLPET